MHSGEVARHSHRQGRWFFCHRSFGGARISRQTASEIHSDAAIMMAGINHISPIQDTIRQAMGAITRWAHPGPRAIPNFWCYGQLPAIAPIETAWKTDHIPGLVTGSNGHWVRTDNYRLFVCYIQAFKAVCAKWNRRKIRNRNSIFAIEILLMML